jgi:hypothetical protein
MPVKVTFLMDEDDPEHEMGLSAPSYEAVNHHVSAVGGYDIEFERVEISEVPSGPEKIPK